MCELDAAGNPVAGVVFGANGLLVYGTTGYQFDPQGNATHLMDDDGLVLAHLAYDAWGQPMSGNNPTPHGYKGQWGYYTDGETGLLLLTHRYFDPATGRFLTRDPIGFEGGINLYAYVNNRILDEIDPWGLLPKGKPNPPRWRPIPTPKDPVYRKIFRLLKVLCVADCVVYASAIVDAIKECQSEGGGDSFVCCVNKHLKRLPNFVGAGCFGCISAVVCHFTIPGVSAICSVAGGFCYPIAQDLIDLACQGFFDPRLGGSGGGHITCWGRVDQCYPAK